MSENMRQLVSTLTPDGKLTLSIARADKPTPGDDEVLIPGRSLADQSL